MNPVSPDSGAANTPVFEAIGLKKDFDDGQVEALRGVDFRISAGEFVAVTGPSGCGKTTLLQMLGGLDQPTAGTLRYRGKSIADLPDLAAYRAREIGFVFQAFHLLPSFTSFENVQIPMFETNRPRSQRADRALELLRAVGLEHRATSSSRKTIRRRKAARRHSSKPCQWPFRAPCRRTYRQP